jgi:hypothetical protein
MLRGLIRRHSRRPKTLLVTREVVEHAVCDEDDMFGEVEAGSDDEEREEEEEYRV